MASYWDEGLITSILRLQTVAKTIADPDFIARAAELQQRATNMKFPIVQAPFIKGDALQLGYELAASTGIGNTNAPSTLGTGDAVSGNKLFWNGGQPNVLFDEDNTVGGQVGTPAQEAFTGGDVAANFSAFAGDLSSSANALYPKVGGPVVSKFTQIAYVLAALLAALAFLYVYEKGRS
jgi:hypothetical protein